MKNKYIVYIGLDVGVQGGISIVDNKNLPIVYKIPVKQVVINKKKKKIYDLCKLVEILKPYQNKKVLFLQESVSSMPGQGVSSAFGFGKSAGVSLGAATALGFTVEEVRASLWKKAFPELNTVEIKGLRWQLKKIRENNKTLKEKALKKGNNKKEIELILAENKKNSGRLNRQIKSKSKAEARFLVSKLYPGLAHNFKAVNTDGVAESLLIALYGKEL